MINHKLGIIVPYRDRYFDLVEFKNHITKYLSDSGINYYLIIVEQDDEKSFNRGKLLNIGTIYAKKLGCDYVVFHDLDMLPEEVDYSYSDVPLHLATNLIGTKDFKRIVFDQYFGGVTLFPIKTFEEINGYSNNYWGWGYEDDDLFYRCDYYNIPLETKRITIDGGNTAALKFNGKNAYVKSKNIFDFNNKTTYNPNGKITIFVSFNPDELELSEDKKEDIMSIFTIPGYDCTITYNSYRRYTFQIFTEQKKIAFIHSDILPNFKTNLTVTIDRENKEISLYQNGVLVDNKRISSFFDYSQEPYFYLGCGNPERKNENNFFKGTINSFAVYNDILDDSEILEISKNQFFGLTQNFGEYKSDYKLMMYYDAKFIKGYQLIDLSENKNNGFINNCEIVGYTFDDYKEIKVPHRRESTFKLIPHEENGYENGGWKNQTTRYNQLRYHNEVLTNSVNFKDDGISTCTFREYGKNTVDNIIQVNVGI
jgi:hypothetical protein